MILRLLIIFSIAFILSCSTPPETIPIKYEVTISHLKSLCKGDHHRITENYTIRGVVVATDWLGELNKSAIIVDETGGLEIAIDSHAIHEQLPIFSEVIIQCNGLMLARIGGKIELGMPPTGTFPLDNIDDTLCARYIRIAAEQRDIAPTTKLFSEIGVNDISSFVKFENVRIDDEEQELKWCDIIEGEPVTTFRTLVDRQNNRFALCTLATCHYATEKMPKNEMSVIGVIDYSDNRPFLRIVNKAFIE